jgi:H+-transporting ATPase
VASRPLRWDMRRVLTVAVALGLSGLVASFLLFWYADKMLGLPREQIQTLIFLKLLVAGHLTIYVTRNQSWFWTKPYPDLRLFLTTEATQVIGTLIAVYGVFVAPIGWSYALAVWGYALLWLPVNDLIAHMVRSVMDHRGQGQNRHLLRSEARMD